MDRQMDGKANGRHKDCQKRDRWRETDSQAYEYVSRHRSTGKAGR